MWQGYQNILGMKYLKGTIFFVVSAVLVVGIPILFLKSTTSSGEDMVDRTNLLI
jgi:hypothetical protein